MRGLIQSLVKGEREVPPRDSYTVLVIDDDESFLHLVGTVLRKSGFNVLPASSGMKGLNMLTYAPGDFRVVLLDYQMPTLDGAKTLEHLRKINPNIKVIGVTSTNPEKLPESFRTGADSFIQKPVNAQVLIETIETLVEVREDNASR